MRDPHPEHARALDFDRWRVGDIATQNVWAALDERPAREAAADMEALAFTAAPLAGEDGLMFVPSEVGDLGERHVRDVARAIRDAEVIEASASLWSLTDRLEPGAWRLVRDGGRFVGMVSAADLVKPAARMAMLAPLLSFEAALALLLPTYSGGRVVDCVDKTTQDNVARLRKKSIAADEHLDDAELLTFPQRLAAVHRLPDLLNDLGPSFAEVEHGELQRIRNRLAHGGPLAAGTRSNLHVLRSLLPVVALARHAWALVDERPGIWRAYAQSEIWFEASGERLVGVGAVPWRHEAPIYGLSAQNPMDRRLSEADNDARHERLVRRVGPTAGVDVRAGAQGGWSERTVLAEGWTRDAAIEVGRLFGQRAIFEIAEGEVRVIACSDGGVRETAPRCR